MGTDIHCFAERRTPKGWEPICTGRDRRDGTRRLLDFYCGQERNYNLFAILAGVQRLTNGGFEPVVPPRGFPPDVSPGQTPDPDSGGFYHNATWLTLKELLDFDWHGKQRLFRGWVNAEQFRLFRQNGRPQQFIEESARLVDNDEMDRLIAAGTDTTGVQTLIEFGIPYGEFAGPFLTETLPLLQKYGRPEDVRLVLYFDS
jgi:hypothetical protein